jgi:dTDP-4-dehydrorhamnose 3,5-epimerase
MKTHGKLLPGVRIIQHTKHQDLRGDFCETWQSGNDGMRGTFRQLNTATSLQYVIRGMHRQDQTKLVMPVLGKIFDVALDPKTGDWFAVNLDKTCALFIPPQYAHGYMTLSEQSIVQYIVDMPYNKSAEENFCWNEFCIEWPSAIVPILSDKDKK